MATNPLDVWRGQASQQLRDHQRELRRLERTKVTKREAVQIAERVMETHDRAKLARTDRLVVLVAALASAASALHGFGVL